MGGWGGGVIWWGRRDGDREKMDNEELREIIQGFLPPIAWSRGTSFWETSPQRKYLCVVNLLGIFNIKFTAEFYLFQLLIFKHKNKDLRCQSFQWANCDIMSWKVVLHIKIDLTFKPVSIFEGNRVRSEVIACLLVFPRMVLGEDWKIGSTLRIPAFHPCDTLQTQAVVWTQLQLANQDWGDAIKSFLLVNLFGGALCCALVSWDNYWTTECLDAM